MSSVNGLRRVFLAPSGFLAIILIALPLLVICAYSVLTRGTYGGVNLPLSSDSYLRVFQPIYLRILWRSVWIAAVATIVCVVIAFPMALYIAQSERYRSVLLNLVMLPFWTSFLIRTYAWMFLLRDTGIVNSALQGMGIIREPLPLLFNTGAVILGLVYGYLPFMVLPLYAALEKMDQSLLEAAQDLGATPWRAVLSIAVPLARPGLVAGSILVFIPCLGAYLTPDLMGGGRTVMIGNLVENQFSSSRDWPFGAAISVIFLGLTLLTVISLQRRSQELL